MLARNLLAPRSIPKQIGNKYTEMIGMIPMWDIAKRFEKYYFYKKYITCWDFLGGPVVKDLPSSTGDAI